MRAKILLLAGFLTIAAWAAEEGAVALSREKALVLCSEAEAFFHEANELGQAEPARAAELCRKAVARYERVLKDSELKNARVYYNLANVYFRMEDLGRAILNYRRALLLDPNDGKLQQNLQYARARRHDQFKESEQTRMMKTLFFWHYDLRLKTRQKLFLGTFLLFWLNAIALLYCSRLSCRVTLILLLILCVSSAGSVGVSLWNMHKQKYGVVVAAQSTPRKGDSESYEPSFAEKLHAGCEFKLIQRRRTWSEVELPDGLSCWLQNKDIEML
ncbi:MAG: tetratricopeptide repeat protein [Lentisphaeria bacterium]|jgi:hypothetical protein